MSTAVFAAPAAPVARGDSEVFTLRQGESYSIEKEGLGQPLHVKVVIAEVSSGFMTINGKSMGPHLKQDIGPPPDPLAHQSARLRGKVATMPRSDMRWSYIILGAGIRLILSEVKEGGAPAIRFEIEHVA